MTIHTLRIMKPVSEDRTEVSIETRQAASSITSAANRIGSAVNAHWSTPGRLMDAEEALAQLAARALTLREQLVIDRRKREAADLVRAKQLEGVR